ncbi:MAG TPA: hypothetical protein VGV85_12640 [Longimicrobiaceae bacterium]|nr:hypothetical protein [Longimicrobiaceae bacterium]
MPRARRALRTVLAAVVLPVLLLGGCSDGDATGPADRGRAELVGSKLAVLAVAVATGPQGRSFFDNFLPCPRRGVVDYHNTPAGRRATFSGCELGDGVTVDGSAELRWTAPNADRRQVRRIELEGSLAVAVDGGAPVRVERLTVEGISFADPARPAVDGVELAALRVTLLGVTTTVDDRGAPRRLFQPEGLTIDAIPNPSNSLAVLTEADLKRIAYHGGMTLAEVLFNESLEIQRGEHSHQNACGTLGVVPDPATRRPHLTYAWSACPIGGGLFVEGAFTQRWTDLDPWTGRLAMVVQGRTTLGGGLPRVTLDRLEWSVSGVSSFPANARISGRLVAGAQERSFSFDLVLDD